MQTGVALVESLLSIQGNLPAVASRRALVALQHVLQCAPHTLSTESNLSEATTLKLLELVHTLFNLNSSLASALLTLRIVQAILQNAPQIAPRLQRYGMLNIAKQLSDTGYIKTRGLRSESGNTEVSDVVKLAASVTSQLQKACKTAHKPTQLKSICGRLNMGDIKALSELRDLLAQPGGVTAHELSQMKLPAAMLKFCETTSDYEQILCQVFSASQQEFCVMVKLLQHIIGAHEQLPVITHLSSRSSGSASLRTLTDPLKLKLFAHQLPPSAQLPKPAAPVQQPEPEVPVGMDEGESDEEVPEAAVAHNMVLAELLADEVPGFAPSSLSPGGNPGGDPFAAAVAAAVRAVSGNRRHILSHSMGSHPASEPESEMVGDISVRAEPLCQIRQLEQHVLRTCSLYNEAYDKFCRELEGSVVFERSGTGDPNRLYSKALVLGCRRASPADILVCGVCVHCW